MSTPKNAPSSRFLCREAWVGASSFLETPETLLCQEIQARVRKIAKKSGKPPAVILDLDSTLYEVCPRTHFILREAVDSLSRHLPKPVKNAFASLLESQVGYSLQDTFLNLGLQLQSPTIVNAWQKMRQYWWDRFFSNTYLKHDRPYPFSVDFVKGLHNDGAHILYLTGRNQAAMRQGTLDNLVRDGFPVDGNQVLLRMKQSTNPDDAGFKARVARGWQEKYKIVACFENEPRNLIRLQSTLPEAMSVFVDTVCSDKRTRAGSGLYRLRTFPGFAPTGLHRGKPTREQ